MFKQENFDKWQKYQRYNLKLTNTFSTNAMDATVIKKSDYRQETIGEGVRNSSDSMWNNIDLTDSSLFDEDNVFLSALDKEYYTPEEACELVRREIQAIYDLKDAVYVSL